MLTASREIRVATALALVLPLVLVVLAAIWGASGVAAWVQRDALYTVFDGTNAPRNLRDAMVYGSIVAQLGLATMILLRRTARLAAWGFIALTLCYMVVGTLVVPVLWLKPLGPLVKLPGLMLLAIIVLVALPRR